MTVRRLSTYEFALRFVAPRYPRIAEILAYPMVRTILDRIDDNPGCIFVILGAPQIFKTLIGQLVALRAQMIDPRPSIWYGKNEITAEQVNDEKFGPLYDNCMPAVVLKGEDEAKPALLYADKYKRTKSRYTLPSGDQLMFLSAGVDINRQSKSAQDLLLDEPWEYDPGWIIEIQRRRADFPRFREIHMTTGPTHGTLACQVWEQSTQEVWHMRCPACKKLIPPEVGDGAQPGGLRYESGAKVRDAEGKRIMSETRASVYFECPHCLVKHANNAHTRAALNDGGIFVSTNANPEFHIHGFRVPALPLRDWSDIVVEKIMAGRAKKRGDMTLTEDLHRKTYATVWREEEHYKDAKLRPVGPYKMGQEWADELKDEAGRPWRFATIDVQQDYYVLVIRMWGKWSRSRLRWASKPMSPTEIVETCQAHGVIRERVFFDARFEPTRVRRLAVLNGFKTLMGDRTQRDYHHKEDGLRRIYDEPKFIDAFAGTTDQSRYPICVEWLFSKQSALHRLFLLRTEKCRPDPMQPEAEEPIWTAAEDAPDWYWREIDAHYKVKETEKDGSERWVWKGMKEDHAGDCEGMHVVVASMGGLTGAESVAPVSAEQKPAA